MSIDQIKEHISPQSKRAAAISTAMSSVVALHGVGATKDDLSKLPLIGVELCAEWAPGIFAAMTIALFAMWFFRYLRERRLQQRTQQLRKLNRGLDQKLLGEEHDRAAARLDESEKNIQQQMASTQTDIRKVFNWKEKRPRGFRIGVSDEGRATLNETWQSILADRTVILDYRAKLTSIDDDIKLHSDIAYVVAPMAAFLGAGIVTVLPIIKHAVAMIAVH